MSESTCKCVLEYGTHLTTFLLLICFILNCITTSCTDNGLIWIHVPDYYDRDYNALISIRSLGWQSEDSLTENMDCSNSASFFGITSIVCLLISLITTIVSIYFSMIRKNTNFTMLFTVIIVICFIMLVSLSSSSSVYFSNCNEALLDMSNDLHFINWGPDYGLIIVWVQCALLISILCLNIVPLIKSPADEKGQKSATATANEMELAITPDEKSPITAEGRVFYQNNNNKTTPRMPPTEAIVANTTDIHDAVNIVHENEGNDTDIIGKKTDCLRKDSHESSASSLHEMNCSPEDKVAVDTSPALNAVNAPHSIADTHPDAKLVVNTHPDKELIAKAHHDEELVAFLEEYKLFDLKEKILSSHLELIHFVRIEKEDLNELCREFQFNPSQKLRLKHAVKLLNKMKFTNEGPDGEQ